MVDQSEAKIFLISTNANFCVGVCVCLSGFLLDDTFEAMGRSFSHFAKRFKMCAKVAV